MVVTDLAFQSVRFRIPRFPDAAIATGLFLSLLLPPSVPLIGAATLALAAIGAKHVLRYRGRPILNPAAVGVVAGAFLFGIAPAWWAGVGPWGEEILVAFGVALILRNPVAWRLPVAFFAIYAPVSVAMKAVLGAALAPKLLLLGVLDPATLFFGLYMVIEPRTAPANPHLYPLYGAVIAVGAVFLPLVIPGPGVLLALLLTNLGAVGVRVALDARAIPIGRLPFPRRPLGDQRSPPTLLPGREAGSAGVAGLVGRPSGDRRRPPGGHRRATGRDRFVRDLAPSGQPRGPTPLGRECTGDPRGLGRHGRGGRRNVHQGQSIHSDRHAQRTAQGPRTFRDPVVQIRPPEPRSSMTR